MTDTTLPQTEKVLSIQWHIPDNWYGSNRRVVLHQEGGFKTKGEAKKLAKRLKRYAKEVYGFNCKKEVTFSKFWECETYIYCGNGPSWACTNYFVTPQMLEDAYTEIEKKEAIAKAERTRVRLENEQRKENHKHYKPSKKWLRH